MLSSTLDLLKFYDSFDVEHRWPKNKYVSWISGKETKNMNYDDSHFIHCSAFVSSVSKKLNVPLLRPPKVRTEGLANKQYDWLEFKGRKYGWVKLESGYDAQMCSNMGYFVIGAYKHFTDPNEGHIGIVRPYECDENHINKYGPKICQAGFINSSSIDARDAFDDRLQYIYWGHKCKYSSI